MPLRGILAINYRIYQYFGGSTTLLLNNLFLVTKKFRELPLAQRVEVSKQLVD